MASQTSVLAALAPGLVERQRRGVEPHAGVAVALEQALDDDVEVGPDRLRAGVAAPEPAEQGGGQEQGQGRHHQQAGDEIDLLRPQLDEEEVEPPAGRNRPAPPAAAGPPADASGSRAVT